MSHDEIPLAHVNDCDRPRFDVAEFYERKRKWSLETFGPAQTTDGVVAHLRSEVRELYEAIVYSGDSDAVNEELADICLLAIDLSWRGEGEASDMGRRFSDAIPPSTAAEYIGMHMDRIESGDMPPRSGAVILFDIAFRALGCDGAPIEAKLAKIKTRKIPDWRTVPADQPIEHVREVDGIDTKETLADAARRVVAERDDARRVLELALAEERVSKERAEWRAEWRADSEALRLERDDVRKVLAAQPHETVAMAAQRAIAERDLQNKRGAELLDMLRSIRAALGVGEGWTAALLIERAGQLHDDSVAYRGLRGKLVDVIDAPADFGDFDLLDLLADRINGPITDAEDDLLEQVRQLEGDVATLKAALHVATRAVQS